MELNENRSESERESEKDALKAVLSRLGLSLKEGQQELLGEHLRLLLDKNKHVNLTNICSFEDAVVLHVEDSLTALPELTSCTGAFCDLGTGGGFPGIPLGVASGRQGTLLDSVKKKAAAVQGFIDALGLSGQLSCLGTRSEEYALEKPENYGAVVVRAVSSLPVVLELASPLLKRGGILIALRGYEDEEALVRADKAAELVGMERSSTRHLTIGEGALLRERSVFTYAKTADPQVSLPRRPGIAAKRPLA